MKTITLKTLKKLLPTILKRHRRKTDRLSVMRKRNAHNPKLPEVQRAKHDAAVRQAITERLAADAKKAALAAAKLELEAALAPTAAVETA